MLRWFLLVALTLPTLAQSVIPAAGSRGNPVDVSVQKDLRLEFVELQTPGAPPQTAPPLTAPPSSDCRITVFAVNQGKESSGPYQVQVLTPRGQVLATAAGSGVFVGRSQTHQLSFRMPADLVAQLQVQLVRRSGPTQTLSLPLASAGATPAPPGGAAASGPELSVSVNDHSSTYVGAKTLLNIEVINKGPVATNGPVDVSLSIAGRSRNFKTPGPVPAGGSVFLTHEIDSSLWAKGPVVIVVDPAGRVPEKNKNDNRYSR